MMLIRIIAKIKESYRIYRQNNQTLPVTIKVIMLCSLVLSFVSKIQD